MRWHGRNSTDKLHKGRGYYHREYYRQHNDDLEQLADKFRMTLSLPLQAEADGNF